MRSVTRTEARLIFHTYVASRVHHHATRAHEGHTIINGKRIRSRAPGSSAVPDEEANVEDGSVCRVTTYTLALLLLLCTLVPIPGCLNRDPDAIPLDPARFPYVFSERERHNEHNSVLRFFDADGDGVEGRLQFSFGEANRPATITASRHDGTTVGTFTLPHARSLSLEFADDLDSDGFKEAFILSREGDSCYLNILNIYLMKNPERALRRFPIMCTAPTGQHLASDDSIILRGLLRRPGSAAPLLIASFTSTRAPQHSGVFALNAFTGALVWRYPMGPRPEFSTASFSAHPHQPEMFFGSSSSETDAVVGSTSADHTYLVGLKEDGTKLFEPRPLGGALGTSRAYLDDFDNHGADELLCLFSSANRLRERSFLKVFNPHNGAQIGPTKEFSERLILPNDLPVITEGSAKRLAICSYAGRVSLIDENLQTILERQLPAEAVRFQLKNLLDDERKELIITLRTNETIILNQRLDPLALIDATGEVTLTRCNAKMEPTLMFDNGRESIVGILSPQSHLARDLAFWGSIAFGALLFAYVTYRGFRMAHVFRTVSANSRDIAVILLDRRGRIEVANDAFCSTVAVPTERCVGARFDAALDREDLRPMREFIGRVWSSRVSLVEPIDLQTPGFSGHLLIRVHPVFIGRFRLGMFFSMYDITSSMRGDRLINWAKVAHNMAHDMKTPLSTIWFTLARIRQELEASPVEGVDRHLASIEEEVRKVDRYIKEFMKLANLNPPNRVSTDLNAFLEELIQGIGEKMPESVRVEMDLSPSLPTVKLDVNLFTVALRNLIDNSVNAMQEKGILRFSTYLVRSLNGSTVYLSLTDTGGGIAEEDVPKLFQPYFSRTDGGTGLGLVITKKIVEDHEGSISFNTRLGYGTEFIIQLPVPSDTSGGERAA